MDVAGVHDIGTARADQRPIASRRIHAIALDDLREHFGLGGHDALGAQLLDSPTSANFRTSVEVDPHIGVGKDNRTLIASFGHQSAMQRGDLALRNHHRRAHHRIGCDKGNRLGDLRRSNAFADGLSVDEQFGRIGFPIEAKLDFAHELGDRFTIGQIDATVERL